MTKFWKQRGQPGVLVKMLCLTHSLRALAVLRCGCVLAVEWLWEQQRVLGH